VEENQMKHVESTEGTSEQVQLTCIEQI